MGKNREYPADAIAMQAYYKQLSDKGDRQQWQYFSNNIS